MLCRSPSFLDHSLFLFCLPRTLTYRTDIQGQNALERVRPCLDALLGKDHWVVDLLDPEHRLVVSGIDRLHRNDVVKALEQAGHVAIFITELPSFC